MYTCPERICNNAQAPRTRLWPQYLLDTTSNSVHPTASNFQFCSSCSSWYLLREREAVLWKTEHSWKRPACLEWLFHKLARGGQSIRVVEAIMAWGDHQRELWWLLWCDLEMSLVWHKKGPKMALGSPPCPSYSREHHSLESSALHSKRPFLALPKTNTNQIQSRQIKISLFSHCPSTLWAFHPIFHVLSSSLNFAAPRTKLAKHFLACLSTGLKY